MQVRIALVDGAPDDLYALISWLQRDDEFRGRVTAVPVVAGPEQMGAIAETITVALGSGGAGAVLASTLTTWLQGRRTRISVETAAGDTSCRVEVEAGNAATTERLLREALQSTGGRP